MVAAEAVCLGSVSDDEAQSGSATRLVPSGPAAAAAACAASRFSGVLPARWRRLKDGAPEAGRGKAQVEGARELSQQAGKERKEGSPLAPCCCCWHPPKAIQPPCLLQAASLSPPALPLAANRPASQRLQPFPTATPGHSGRQAERQSPPAQPSPGLLPACLPPFPATAAARSNPNCRRLQPQSSSLASFLLSCLRAPHLLPPAAHIPPYPTPDLPLPRRQSRGFLFPGPGCKTRVILKWILV